VSDEGPCVILCLKLGAEVWTGDKAWMKLDLPLTIKVIR
jgi:PIN domain nuclease of toxin-antitoxin system